MLLQIKNLRVRNTQNQQRLIQDVSFYVAEGERVALIGESGAGKSLLLLSLLGLLPDGIVISSGEVEYQGKRLGDEVSMEGIRGKEIAYVSQDPDLAWNPVRTVGSQIDEVLRTHFRDLSKTQRRERVLEALRECGLDFNRVYAAYPWELSGGMSQRALIAMAVVGRPKLLLADEPVSNLDEETKEETLGFLSRITKAHGMAVLWVCHDLKTAFALSDRVLVLQEGRLIEDGKSEEVRKAAQHPGTLEMLKVWTSLHGGAAL